MLQHEETHQTKAALLQVQINSARQSNVQKKKSAETRQCPEEHPKQFLEKLTI